MTGLSLGPDITLEDNVLSFRNWSFLQGVAKFFPVQDGLRMEFWSYGKLATAQHLPMSLFHSSRTDTARFRPSRDATGSCTVSYIEKTGLPIFHFDAMTPSGYLKMTPAKDGLHIVYMDAELRVLTGAHVPIARIRELQGVEPAPLPSFSPQSLALEKEAEDEIHS